LIERRTKILKKKIKKTKQGPVFPSSQRLREPTEFASPHRPEREGTYKGNNHLIKNLHIRLLQTLSLSFSYTRNRKKKEEEEDQVNQVGLSHSKQSGGGRRMWSTRESTFLLPLFFFFLIKKNSNAHGT
jgi:hypothetical protein